MMIPVHKAGVHKAVCPPWAAEARLRSTQQQLLQLAMPQQIAPRRFMTSEPQRAAAGSLNGDGPACLVYMLMALLSPPETISDRGTPIRSLSPPLYSPGTRVSFDSGGNEVDHTRTCDDACRRRKGEGVTPAPINPWTTYFVKRERQPAGVLVPFFTSDTSTRLGCQHAAGGLYGRPIASRLYPNIAAASYPSTTEVPFLNSPFTQLASHPGALSSLPTPCHPYPSPSPPCPPRQAQLCSAPPSPVSSSTLTHRHPRRPHPP